MSGMLTIFLGLKEDHYEKDVTQFGLNLSLHLKQKLSILVSNNPSVNYTKYVENSINIEFLPKITGFATIDTILFMLLNAHRYSILQVFHFCRFSFVAAFFFKLSCMMHLKKSITLLKADYNGYSLDKTKKQFSPITWIVGSKVIEIVTFETKDSFKVFTKANIFPSVFHIPNGYYQSLDFHQKLINKKENILVFAGRISEYQKNAEEFFEALPKFLRKNNNWSAHIFGTLDVNLQNKIKILIEENSDIVDRLYLRGFASRWDFEDTLSRAKLLALTSRHEGYPALLVEARAWGIRVVSSEVNGIFDIAAGTESFLLYKIGNIEQLIECLNASAQNSKYYKENIYIHERDKFLQENSWPSLTRPLAEFIDALSS